MFIFLSFAWNTDTIMREKVKRPENGLDTFFIHFCVKEVSDMNENKFQAGLIKEIKNRFPGSVVLKNDPTYIQGIPDLIVLWKDRWAMLECKKSSKASKRPNQEYWIKKLGAMSFASFIFPENKEEVLNELERSFRYGGKARVPKRKQVPLVELRRGKTTSNIFKPLSGGKRNGAA